MAEPQSVATPTGSAVIAGSIVWAFGVWKGDGVYFEPYALVAFAVGATLVAGRIRRTS